MPTITPKLQESIKETKAYQPCTVDKDDEITSFTEGSWKVVRAISKYKKIILAQELFWTFTNMSWQNVNFTNK